MDAKQQLIHAIEVSISPVSSQHDRVQAFHIIEQVKEDPLKLIQYGCSLGELSGSSVLQYYGLQLIEEAIKLHWNKYDSSTKKEITDFMMKFLNNRTGEDVGIGLATKDRISRVIVEIAKREWPQQWQTFVKELICASQLGNLQAELVLYVLLRLSEDVATLQILQGSRRRDILHGLNQQMDEIFSFLFSLLETQYEKFKSPNLSTSDRNSHCQVIQVLFTVLGSFIEWVDPQHLMSHQDKFFLSITYLIKDPSLKLQVADCLLQLVSRKGKGSDRVFIFALFDENFLQTILYSANESPQDTTHAQNYLHLKTISQVISMLGLQLCQLWGKEPSVEEPACFELYLEALLALFKHPSVTVHSYSRLTWLQIFKHEIASKLACVKKFTLPWIEAALTKIVKEGLPSEENCVASTYAALDFDDDEEFLTFFNKMRCGVLELLAITSLMNVDAYMKCMKEMASSTLQMTSVDHSSSSLYRSWEALHLVLYYVVPKLFETNSIGPYLNDIASLLMHIIEYETIDPLVMSEVLSSMSALNGVLEEAPDSVIFKVTAKLFSIINVKINEGDENPKSIGQLKRHAGELLVKLCTIHPNKFSVTFESLEQNLDSMKDLSSEKIALQKALIILTSPTDLNRILEKILVPLQSYLESIRSILNKPTSLVSYLGLDVCSGFKDDEKRWNRQKLHNCFLLVTNVMKCGGCQIEGYKNVVKNLIQPCLKIIFGGLRSFNGFWTVESHNALAPFFKDVLNMSAKTCNVLLGLHANNKNLDKEDHLTRFQDFMNNVYENLILMYGSVLKSNPEILYEIPQLPDYLQHSMLYNMENLPDVKLRSIIRWFMLDFCVDCPSHLRSTVLLPVLQHFCPAMLSILAKRWEHLVILVAKNQQPEVEISLQEMIDDYTIRWLTRQYVEFFNDVLIVKVESCETEEVDMEDSERSKMPNDSVTLNKALISELGRSLICVESLCQPILFTMLQCLDCQDTLCSRKVLKPLCATLQFLFDENFLTENIVHTLIMRSFNALHVQGQLSADLVPLLDFFFTIYGMLRTRFPICEIFETFDVIDKTLLKSFDERIIKMKTLEVKEIKAAKTMFKNLMKNVIGAPISEAMKKDIQIADLPPIYRKPRLKTVRLEDKTSDLDLTSLFDRPL